MTKHLCILCEGKTELLFANSVLGPYLLTNKGIIVLPQLLITNNKRNIKGGMLNYSQAKRDINNMIMSHQDRKDISYYFTTMFDLYALPTDFPGYEEAKGKKDYEQVTSLEKSLSDDINNYKFIPYIQLHEFEALVLCNIKRLKADYPKASSELDELTKAISASYANNTELVNNGPSTAPSKRIIKAMEGKYNYDKPKSGVDTTK